jgi:uncharacterized protein YkwD
MTFPVLPLVQSRPRKVLAAALAVLLVLVIGYAASSLWGSSGNAAALPAPVNRANPPADGAKTGPIAAPARVQPAERNRTRLPEDQTQRLSYRIPVATDNTPADTTPSDATTPTSNGSSSTKAPTPPSAPEQSSGSGYSNSSYAYSVLSQLNSERAAHGVPALRMNSLLISSAHAHNLAMARANEMSHQLPGEPYFSTRIANAGYNYRNAGENIGWNSATSRNAALSLETDMYAEGPPPSGSVNHYSNIVSRNYTDVGIEVYIDTVHHKLWLTVDFGSR